jgi:hypothetical protein
LVGISPQSGKFDATNPPPVDFDIFIDGGNSSSCLSAAVSPKRNSSASQLSTQSALLRFPPLSTFPSPPPPDELFDEELVERISFLLLLVDKELPPKLLVELRLLNLLLAGETTANCCLLGEFRHILPVDEFR